MGHTDHERRRLALQASVLNPLTDAFLRRAGISAGMNVLELGCGIGERAPAYPACLPIWDLGITTHRRAPIPIAGFWQ
jgi:hypothetical protein